MNSFKRFIEECDAAIRAGRIGAVAPRLRKVNTARVPRELRLPLAQICRRAGLQDIGLTLLNRMVLRDGREKATPAEITEYGVLLLRAGATNEAAQFLGGRKVESVPDAFLFRAFLHFTRWEFEAATHELNKYLSFSLEPYARLIGKVNLAYALVETGEFDHARALLDECSRSTEGLGTRLISNCHALRGQLLVQMGHLKEGRGEFEAASRLLRDAGTNDEFFVYKWKCIVGALETGKTSILETLRTKAREQFSWEDARLADLYSCKIKFDNVRFLHLFFGTPFPEFRARLVRETRFSPNRDAYILGSKSAPRFDLQSGTIDGRPVDGAGHISHQMIEVMMRDFYHPLRIPGLFSELFPTEHYNVTDSPNRIHQILNRTRRWMHEQRIPAEIRQRSGFYSLRLTGQFSIRVPLRREPKDLMQLNFDRLRQTYSSKADFSARQAREELKFSRRTLQRVLTWALENGHLFRSGENKETRYFFKESERLVA